METATVGTDAPVEYVGLERKANHYWLTLEELQLYAKAKRGVTWFVHVEHFMPQADGEGKPTREGYDSMGNVEVTRKAMLHYAAEAFDAAKRVYKNENIKHLLHVSDLGECIFVGGGKFLVSHDRR